MLFMVTNICVAYNCILKFISRCLWKPKFLTFIKTDPVRNRVRIGFYYACRIGILNAAVFQIRSKKKTPHTIRLPVPFLSKTQSKCLNFAALHFQWWRHYLHENILIWALNNNRTKRNLSPYRLGISGPIQYSAAGCKVQFISISKVSKCIDCTVA